MSPPTVLPDDYQSSGSGRAGSGQAPSPTAPAAEAGGSGSGGRRARAGSHRDRGRGRRAQRTRRILASQSVRDAVVSLAGLAGRPVRNQSGQEIGRLHDVVARWSDGQTYPPVTGLVVRVGHRLAFVDASVIDRFEHAQVLLRSARLDLRDFVRRPGEVILAHDVLDHQLVDVDGVQVIRAADLYLAEVLGRIRLVGVDVSAQTLLRRLGPRRWRPRPTPDRVIDWAAIQPFGEIEQRDSSEGGEAAGTERAGGTGGAGARSGTSGAGGRGGTGGADGTGGGSGIRGTGGADGTGSAAPEVRLRASHEGLHRLRPGELADLLEDLRRPERQELLATLDPDEAADALEEMEDDDVASLLRDATPERATELLASMEPDEAADALRDLSAEDRQELLGRMPVAAAAPLLEILGYPEDRAGGFMTTALVTATMAERVATVVDRLSEAREHDADIDAVAVVDDAGLLVGDLSLLDLLLALRTDPDLKLRSILDDEEPVTVGPEAAAAEVAERLVQARRLSLLVVVDGRPVGRILADDVLDAMVPAKGRLHFHRLLQ